jgi:hypothetical protein
MLATLMFAACGSGSQTNSTASQAASTTASTSTSPSSAGHAPENASIALSSPAFKTETPLPARYTCDGGNVSPPLHWGNIPTDTKELALFLVNMRPVNGKLFANWGVLGLKPTESGLAAGSLPAEAITGRNSLGQINYSVCPAKGKEENYIFVIYSLPSQLSAQPGFNAVALREAAFHAAKSEGLLSVSYTRH